MQGETATLHGGISSSTLPDIGTRDLTIRDDTGSIFGSTTTANDGSFEYRTPPLATTGTHSFTVNFRERDNLASSSAAVSFAVLAPTALTVEGPGVLRLGDVLELEGHLAQADGQPVPGAQVWVGDTDGEPLFTAADGSFRLELPMEPELEDPEVETTVEIAVGFDGTEHLAPTLGGHSVVVGVPRLIADPLEPVTRGESATLRGTVLLGSYPLADVAVTTRQGLRAVTGDAGSFFLSHPVPAGNPLGANAVAVSAPSLGVDAVYLFDVKSAVNLVAVPTEDVRPGRELPVSYTHLTLPTKRIV